MVADPLFWLYGSLFFCSSGILRLILDGRKKKRVLIGLIPLLFSFSFLTVFWAVSSDFSFSSARNGLLFCASAVLPGLLAGWHPLALILPPAAVLAISIKLEIPVAPLVYKDIKPLAVLTCYPSREGQVFYEWTSAGSKPVLGRLSGSQIAAVLRKEILPDYFFFLEDPWTVVGLLSENLAISNLPGESNEIFFSLSEGSDSVSPFSRYEYPALRFLDPGYFNSYTFTVRYNKELLILERK